MRLRFGNILIRRESFFLLTIGLLIFGLTQPPAARALPRNQLQAYVKQGIEKGFNLEEKEAIAWLTKASAMDRENPAPYAYLGFAHLFFFELTFDETERKGKEQAMEAYTQQALAKAEKRLEKDPRDGEAVWAIAMAKLTMTRFFITQRRYLAFAREAKNVWDYLEKARELDPENYDVYFAMGILHYHIDHLPGLTRFFSSLWVTSGDREKGLKEIEIAAQKGYLFKELAQSELVSIYSNFEGKPERALPLAKELRERFPRNYNLLFALAGIHSDLGRVPEALGYAKEIEAGIQSGSPPFRPELWPRYYLTMGKILFDQGDYEKAIPFFRQTTLHTARYYARNRAWALVRLGMIHDIRQEREAAEKSYQAALDVEGGEGVAQALAKRYLKVPYTLEKKNPPAAEGNGKKN